MQEHVRVTSAIENAYSSTVSKVGSSTSVASEVPKSDDFSPYPFGSPKNQTGSDTPVFGKSLSLLKSKTNETSKSQTSKEPSSDQSSSIQFNFQYRGPFDITPL